jgi:hypothetical protein
MSWATLTLWERGLQAWGGVGEPMVYLTTPTPGSPRPHQLC